MGMTAPDGRSRRIDGYIARPDNGDPVSQFKRIRRF